MAARELEGTVRELDVFKGRNGHQYEIYRAVGPFAHEYATEEELSPTMKRDNRLFSDLYHLAGRWGYSRNALPPRFSYESTRKHNGLQNTHDVAFLAVDPTPDGEVVVADLLVFSDKRYPQLGMYCYIYTKPEHRGQGICSELIERSKKYWFSTGGEAIALHTEFLKAHKRYIDPEKGGFDNWFGLPPTTDDGSEKGVVMINGNGRDIDELVNAHFAAGSSLEVEPFSGSHHAQGLLLCSAFQDTTPNFEKRAITIPALGIDGGWNSEGRFIQQFLYGRPEDVVLALMTKNHRLIGIGAVTHPNEILDRTSVTPSLFVHINYKMMGEEILRAKIKEKTGLTDF